MSQDWQKILYDVLAHQRFPALSWVHKPSSVVITNTASASDGTNLTTYTFSAQAIGTASSDRYVVVGFGAESLGTTTVLSSATIGGVAATITKQQTNVSAIDIISGLIIANVPTGTTADVVLTFNSGQLRAAISVFTMTGNSSITATATASETTATDDPQSTTLDIPASGGAIAFSFADASSSTTTWAGLTVRSDALVETVTGTSASDVFATAQTGLTISADFSGSVGRGSLVAAAWGPA